MAKSFKTAKTIKLFLDECREYIDSLEHDLVTLEGGDTDEEMIKRVKRNVHTLKGSSAMLEFNDISVISHEIEDVLAKMEPAFPDVDAGSISEIFNKVDRIKELVAKIESGEYEDDRGRTPAAKTPDESPAEKTPAAPTVAPPRAKPAIEEKPPPPAPSVAPSPPPPTAAPSDALLSGAERVDLVSVLGDRLRPGLERCFKIFQDVESKFVLAEGSEPDAELLDSLLEDAKYLFSTLAPMGVPDVCHLLYRLELVLDSVKEGKIPTASDLVGFVFSGITIVKAMLESRIESRPEGEARGADRWHLDADKRLKTLGRDKDILTEEAALEIFRRLAIEENISALLMPFEKHMIAQAMIHGRRVFRVSFVVPASDREVLVNLPEIGKAFFEKGRIAASVYQICSSPQGLAYRVHFFQTTDAHEEELEQVAGVIEDVKELEIKHISLLSDHPVKKEAAPKPSQADEKKAPEPPARADEEEKTPQAPPPRKNPAGRRRAAQWRRGRRKRRSGLTRKSWT